MPRWTIVLATLAALLLLTSTTFQRPQLQVSCLASQLEEVDETTSAAESRVTVKKMLATESALEADLFDADGTLAESQPNQQQDSQVLDSELVPKKETLFQSDALDVSALSSMDCHMRNIDYCFAGIMATSNQALPETDAALESRCDELKAATSCMAIYNKRCQTLKVFSAIAPMVNMNEQQRQLPAELRDAPLPPALESLLMNTNSSVDIGDDESSLSQEQRDALTQLQLKNSDLMSLCEPGAKRSKTNKLIRLRVFQIAKCVNQRMPHLRPCIEDLKVALQLFYEPNRSLPLKPTCCSISRFRHCATKALDNICGISSFAQLEASFSGPGGAGGAPLKTIERVCRQAAHFESAYCNEVLPPTGMKAPQRRGRKASKLAKALDLISFAPAAQ